MSIPVVPLRPLPPGRTAYADIPIKWRRSLGTEIKISEGGFQNDRRDPGNLSSDGVWRGTMRGVISDTYAAFLKCSVSTLTIADMLAITHERSMEVGWYLIQAAGFDELEPFSVARFFVDWLWGSGPDAIDEMQRLIGVPVDGVIGPITRAAFAAWCAGATYRWHGMLFSGPEAALHHACDARNRYHRWVVTVRPALAYALGTQRADGSWTGWTGRVEHYRPQVPGELAELGAAPITPPIPGRRPVQPIPKPILGEPAPSLWERIIAFIAALFGGPAQEPAT